MTSDGTDGTDEPSTAPGSAMPLGRRRRLAIVTAVAVLVVAVLGVGTYAAVRLIGGGPHPEDVLPASTIAVVSVDLDPSAGQKIEAIRTMRKFPDLRKQIDLGPGDDVRKLIFDKMIASGGCRSMSFDRDVGSWLGNRAALGAVDLGEASPTPVLALQVQDAAAARRGLDRIMACSHPADVGIAMAAGYAIISDSTAHARLIVADGRSHDLADDASYQHWTGQTGDAGVLSFYVAKSAADLGLRELDRGMFGADLGSLKDTLKGFRGMAGTLRFSEGGAELATATGGVHATDGSAVGDAVGRLPADTALALGIGVPGDYATTLVDRVAGLDGGTRTAFIKQTRAQTGLRLPEDLQTMLGTALVLSVDGTPPRQLSSLDGISSLPAAVTVTGDGPGIDAVLSRVQHRTRTSLADLGLTERKDDTHVTVATSATYAARVRQHGDLGSDGTFEKVVPDADHAVAVFFLRIDDAWRQKIAELVGNASGPADAAAVDSDLAPFQALGFSAWNDGGITHTLLKLATN
ncbi:DUF3352 domain-containing protein [Nocardioides terrisoli]|uniref:DUF3352 domain-containing protein n=1 Tax=Nocardioides terrisoli TaxID=3388267 RepID=UPI00287B7EF6|nr:DUF3352 domain-containing protein [Nocardioides marmorisolisilvae]